MRTVAFGTFVLEVDFGTGQRGYFGTVGIVVHMDWVESIVVDIEECPVEFGIAEIGIVVAAGNTVVDIGG